MGSARYIELRPSLPMAFSLIRLSVFANEHPPKLGSYSCPPEAVGQVCCHPR